MKEETYTFLGLPVTVNVPSTNEEYDKAAGEVNSACAEAVDKYMFHNWGGKFRENFCLAVEKETGIAWPVNEDAMKSATPKKDGTVSDVHISHGAYFKLVLAQTGREALTFKDLATDVASKLAFDPGAASTGGRIAKEFVTAAEGVVEKDKTTPGTLAAVVAKLNGLNQGLNLSDAPSVEELARGIKANADRKKREALADLDVG